LSIRCSSMDRPAQKSYWGKKEEEEKKEKKILQDNPDYPVVITDGNMDEAIAKYPFLVVDCWAEWCAPCKMIGPVIEKLASSQKGDIVFGKLDVDSNPNSSARFNIRSIPNLLVFKEVIKWEMLSVLCRRRCYWKRSTRIDKNIRLIGS